MEETWCCKPTETSIDYMIRLWSDTALWLALDFMEKHEAKEGVCILWDMKQFWRRISLEQLKKDCMSRSSFSRVKTLVEGNKPFFILHRHIARRAWDVYHEREI